LGILLLKGQSSTLKGSFLGLDLQGMTDPADPEVDLLVQKGDKPEGALFQEDLDSGRVMLMVQESDLFANQRYGGFIEATV
jgi:hypothetical protein